MWLLILLAVHNNDPKDVPGRIELTFQDKLSCEQTLQTMTYWLKFNQFKIEGRCIKK
jgi:hypothetical protein